MHDETAVGIDKAQQEVKACGHPDIHDVRVPLLVRCKGCELMLAARAFRALPAREQTGLIERPINRAFAHAGNACVYHHPGELAIADFSMQECELTDGG